MAEYKRPKGFEETVYKNWTSAVESNQAQLDREIQDLKWQVAEEQWDAEDRAARSATTIQGIAIAARPCLSIPKIKQPMSIVDAQFRSAHLGIQVHPLSEDADDDTAEVLQDLIRAIERDSNASQARWWAFDRAKQAGRGWYRINTVYDDSTPDPFDQKVVIERILHQSAVVMDPAATKADCSDAEWAFLSAWMPLSVFGRRWPNAKLTKDVEDTTSDDLTLETLTDQTPGWVDERGDRKAVQVAEYWYKTYSQETVTSLDGLKTRARDKQTLRWCIAVPGGEKGLEIVEDQEWNGDDIPLIPAMWSELQPFDSERRFEGMVRPARDGGKLYNYMASEAVSVIGSLPKSPWIGDIEQFEPYMAAWKQSGVRIMPFLPVASVVKEGHLLPRPQRVQADASGLQPLMIMLQQADEFIQSSTASPDSVLGRRNPSAESGKAIKALQGQSEAANSSGIQNFSDVTMKYEARVLIGMIKRIYDRPARVVHALNPQGDRRPVMLNAPHVIEEGKRPVRVPQPGQQAPGMPPQGPGGPQGPQQQGLKPKTYDLSKGVYGVNVTIGKTWNTAREQGAELLLGLMESNPQLGLLLAPIMLRFQDGPGMSEAADLVKEFRDKQMGPMGQKDGDAPDSSQLMAQLEAMKGQMEQMQQAGQAQQQEIETDQAKQSAMLQKAQIDAQIESKKIEADMRKAEMDNATRIQVAEIAAGAKIDSEKLNAMISMALDRSKSEQADFNRRHAADLKGSEAAHDVALKLADQEREDEQAERAASQADRDRGNG